MIICSCNCLSETDVRTACHTGHAPRTPGQVYRCLGCSPQCGRCARTIKSIIEQAAAPPCPLAEGEFCAGREAANAVAALTGEAAE